ncbi:MAG: AraC family transcriptional regulator [Muribaculum sp.]|nr:AraC family transcriptional regulator [Muribaculum sp.]
MNEEMRESRLRGNDIFPFVLYEMPSGGQPLSAAFHWQEDVEILAVNGGEIELTLDGASSILRAGMIVCINPGQIHGFRGVTPDAHCDIFIFPLQHLLFMSEDHDQRRYLRFLADGKLGFPLYLSENPTALQIVRQIIRIHRQLPPAYEMETKALLLLLIVQLIQTDAFVPLRPTRHSDLCKEILSYIHQHYMEKLTVSDVATAVGISPTYFSTFFAQHFFQHFSEYLRCYRIEQACVLLASTSMTVTDVAMATGFSSGSHFIRQFRAVKGVTPFAYRKTYET